MLIGRTKVCGSAQRRCHGAVLQHGSLLWRTSSAAPELPGMADLAGSVGFSPPSHDGGPEPALQFQAHPIELENLADLWLASLSRRLGFAWQEDDLDEKELRRAETLVESRYSGDNWTKNRGRAALASQESL